VTILAAASVYPGNQCAIGRRQLIDLKENTIPDFFTIARPELFTNWVPWEQFINRSPMTLRLHNGSLIHFKGFHDSGDAGSANWGAVMLQEVYHPLGGVGIPQNVYYAIDKALRCPAAPFRFIISDTNQAPPDHWLHQEFGDTGRPGHEVVMFDWEENKHNLPPAQVRSLETEWGADPMLRELLKPGWREVISGQPVFGDVFQPAIHVNEALEVDEDEPVYRSWDPSFVQPWVTWSQIIDGQWTVLGEFLPKQVFLPDLIRGVQQYSAEHFAGCSFRDVADDAVRQRKDVGVPIDVMRQHGINPISRPTDTIRSGLEIMVDYLSRLTRGGGSAFQIHPRCKATIQCLAHGYRWQEGRDDRVRDAPLKDGFYDNGADSLRYFAINKLRVSPRRRAPRQQEFANYGGGVMQQPFEEPRFYG
jgi:hypothetical protein